MGKRWSGEMRSRPTIVCAYNTNLIENNEKNHLMNEFYLVNWHRHCIKKKTSKYRRSSISLWNSIKKPQTLFVRVISWHMLALCLVINGMNLRPAIQNFQFDKTIGDKFNVHDVLRLDDLLNKSVAAKSVYQAILRFSKRLPFSNHTIYWGPFDFFVYFVHSLSR